MRQCPLCEHLYDDGTDFCPQDGRVLFFPDPLLGKIVDNKYRVDAMLGGGGQGTVYRAFHIHLQRKTAFKVIRGDFVSDPIMTARFKREALAAARLKHPNIVTVYDFGISQEAGAYLVLEYLEGHSLRHEIQSSKAIPLQQAIELMRQVCAAVEAAHAEGVIHRDLKPDNIFLEARGDGGLRAKILDFGVAKLRGTADLEGGDSDQGSSESGEVTIAGRVFGTPAYMSPEQCSGQRLDARSDVYALGCVFYEMLTGRPPFLFTGTTDLYTKHLSEMPPPPSSQMPGVPPAVDALILAALAKRREDRVQSAGDFLQALSGVKGATGALLWAADSGPIEPPARVAPEALVTAAATPNNLPQHVTSFVGRERVLDEITSLLETHRLMTLTGPGGCGKTRLSIEAASKVLANYPGGVWLVELAAIADRALVPHAVASALGVAEDPAQPVLASLVRFLESRRALLLLDNCEHVVAACAELAGRLLRATPDLSIVASSQESLGIQGELVLPVTPLSVPEESDADAARAEAVLLFEDRARLSNPRFVLTDENLPLVATICRQLDGIPLAIELAAARTKLLSVQQIAERLDDRFKLLTQGDRNAQPRQRTLQGAIDWSYDLLDEDERALFERLSVFAGGWTLEAAEAVVGKDEGGRSKDESEGDDSGPIRPSTFHLHPSDVLDLLGRLVDKSLVAVDEQGAEARYRFLQSIRQYSARKLQESGLAPSVRTRHRDYFHALAEAAEPALRGARQREWLERLELEHDNLRAALEWSKANAAVSDSLLRLVGSLAEFWQVRAHAREGREWVEAALAASRVDAPAARAKALHCAGILSRVLGDYGIAKSYLDESLAIRRSLGEGPGIIGTLNALALLAQWQGNHERAEALALEAIEPARGMDLVWEIGSALNIVGCTKCFLGDYERAVTLLEESLDHFRRTGDKRKIGGTLNNLGITFAGLGDYVRARSYLEEQLALQWETGDTWEIATSLNNLGEIALRQGDYDRAAELLTQSLQLYEKAGDKRGVAYSLECFVALGAARGLYDHATRLAGAASALRASLGSPLSPIEQADLDRHLEPARRALGEDCYRRAFDAGKVMTRARAIEVALNGGS